MGGYKRRNDSEDRGRDTRQRVESHRDNRNGKNRHGWGESRWGGRGGRGNGRYYYNNRPSRGRQSNYRGTYRGPGQRAYRGRYNRSPSYSSRYSDSYSYSYSRTSRNSARDVEARFEQFVKDLHDGDGKAGKAPRQQPQQPPPPQPQPQQKRSPSGSNEQARPSGQEGKATETVTSDKWEATRPRDGETRAKADRSSAERVCSLSGGGRAYSLPPSPTVPAAVRTPLQAVPAQSIAENEARGPASPTAMQGLSAEPTIPTYDTIAQTSSSAILKDQLAPTPQKYGHTGVASSSSSSTLLRRQRTTATAAESARRPPPKDSKSERKRENNSKAGEARGKHPLIFKDEQDYARWLTGERATVVVCGSENDGRNRGSDRVEGHTEDDERAIVSSHRRAHHSFSSSSTNPPAPHEVATRPQQLQRLPGPRQTLHLTEHWQDVSTERKYLVRTDEAVLKQLRSRLFTYKDGLTSSNGSITGGGAVTNWTSAPDHAAHTQHQRLPDDATQTETTAETTTPLRDKAEEEEAADIPKRETSLRECNVEETSASSLRSSSPPVAAASAETKRGDESQGTTGEESDLHERARCFQAHFVRGRVHPKPPWRICINECDNYEHPYYLNWLDEFDQRKRNSRQTTRGEGTGDEEAEGKAADRKKKEKEKEKTRGEKDHDSNGTKSVSPTLSSPTCMRDVIAFYKAAVEAKRSKANSSATQE